MCIDTASGQGLDHSAFSVIDITEMPYRQVMVYRNNKINPIQFPTVVMNAAKKYNEAWVLCEYNSPGDQVANLITEEFEYEQMFYTETKGRKGQVLSLGFKSKAKPGVTTTSSIKIQGCVNLKTMIESDQLIINDFWTIRELSNFIVNKESYAANAGHNDDIVMGLVLLGWLVMQPLFKEITDQNLRSALYSSQKKFDSSDDMPSAIFGSNDLEINYLIDDEGQLWYHDDNYYDEDDDFGWNNGGNYNGSGGIF